MGVLIDLAAFFAASLVGVGCLYLITTAVWVVARGFGMKFTWDKVLDTTVVVTAVIVLGFVLLGCVAPMAPCLSGFEVGVNGGQNWGRWRGANDYNRKGDVIAGDRTNVRDNYVGGHATAFFDTTGACRAYDEE